MWLNLDNQKLGTKALLPLAACAALFALVLGIGIFWLTQITGEYANLVERSNLALTKVMRANRLASQIGYGNRVILDFQAENPVSLEAQAQLRTASESARKLLKEAAELIPQHAKSLLSFEERFEQLAKESKSPVERALAIPGVDDTTKLTRTELEETAKVAKLLDAIDVKIQGINKDLTKFNDERIAENSSFSASLHTSANNALVAILIAGVLSVAVGAAISHWLSKRTVVQPILKLADQMGKIADNNLDIDVDGLKRKDEIGVMARALQKFKKNALAWQASDARAAEERNRAEEERRAYEAKILREERSVVAKSIGFGLSRLSDKDLTHRMNEDLPDAYRQLQTTLTRHFLRLKKRWVMLSTDQIRSALHQWKLRVRLTIFLVVPSNKRPPLRRLSLRFQKSPQQWPRPPLAQNTPAKSFQQAKRTRNIAAKLSRMLSLR